MPRVGPATDDWIALVIDSTVVTKALEQVERGPIWLTASPANRQIAEQLWRKGDVPPDWVTIFDPNGDRDEEVVSDIPATIDEHYPDPGGCRLHVLGAALTDALAALLAESRRRRGQGRCRWLRLGPRLIPPASSLCRDSQPAIPLH